MRHFFYLAIMLSVSSCTNGTEQPTQDTSASITPNMTEASLAQMEWMNQPESFQITDGSLSVTVKEGTDFFNNPEDGSIAGTAPFLCREIPGDFVAKALVQPDFNAQWNALALMVYLDSLHWIKFAFENSDATGASIVTVVTKGTSDDANGVILNDQQQVWLAMVRKNNIYSMHWSVDGKDYKMARLTAMPTHDAARIGIEAQSPVGETATHLIHAFDIEERTVEDLRKLE